MNIKVCDRCGKIYLYNSNDKFQKGGVCACKVIRTHPPEIGIKEIEYELCDNCCDALFTFLELDTKYSRDGRQSEDIWKGNL